MSLPNTSKLEAISYFQTYRFLIWKSILKEYDDLINKVIKFLINFYYKFYVFIVRLCTGLTILLSRQLEPKNFSYIYLIYIQKTCVMFTFWSQFNSIQI